MMNEFWLPGYSEKWVCSSCGAVHFYRPESGCQKCKQQKLERVSIVVVEHKRSSSDELRLDIDKMNLHEEWTNQPQQFYVWAKKAADAQLAYNQAKSKLDLVSAELNKDIRDDPDSYDLAGKPTKDAIDAAVIVQPTYRSAVDRVNNAHHELQVAQAGVNALEHRKRALTMLVELFTKEYYSDPHPKTVSSESDELLMESRRRKRQKERALAEENQERGED